MRYFFFLTSFCIASFSFLTGCTPSPTRTTNRTPATPPDPASVVPYTKPVYTYEATSRLPDLDESTLQAVFYVNQSHAAASDQGPGTKEQPFLTLMGSRNAVMQSLSNGIPTKLVIGPGIYREDARYYLRLNQQADPATQQTLFVMEGSEKGKVILSGSFEAHPDYGDFRPSTWTPVPGAPGVYQHDWPFGTHVEAGPWINTYGFAKLPGVMQRSEMIYLNGQHLRQVLAERYEWVDPDGKQGVDDYGTGKGGDPSNQPGRLVFDRRLLGREDLASLDPGTFAVFTAEEVKDDLHGTIVMRLPTGLTMDDTLTIEVAQWKGRGWSPMFIAANKDNFVIRNLTIQHGAMGPMGSAMVVNNCSNFLIEDCDISRNIATGLQLNTSRSGILRRVTANHNGANGMGMGNNTKEIFMEDCETSFNNYRGGWAGWLGWHASGFKSGNVHNITVRRHVSVGNYANGIWYDVYCTNILVEDSFFYGNKRMGVMYELTRPNGGPHVLRHSIAAENDNTGVYVTMASNTRVEDNLVIRNGGGGYVETDRKHTQLLYKFRDHPHGPTTAEEWENVTIQRNRFLSDIPGQKAIDYLDRKAEPLTQYDRVLKVLHSSGNQYGVPEADAAFRLPSGDWTDYEGWLTLLTEKNSPVPDTDSEWTPGGLESDRRLEFTSAATSDISQLANAMEVPLPEARIQEYWQRTDAGLYSPPYLHYDRQHD